MTSQIKHIPIVIQAYLDSTRLILPDALLPSGHESSELYKRLAAYIEVVSVATGVDVKVEIVYTDSLRSEAISFGGMHYIIHDQYFGQVMNMLNRLFLYGASQETKYIYFHKLVSQILSRYGFYEESIFAANRYRRMRADMDHKAKQQENIQHGLYTHIQELYVLLHEHAHIVFKKHPTMLRELNIEVISWLDHYRAEDEKLSPNLFEELTKGLPTEEGRFIKENMEKILQSKRSSVQFCSEIIAREDLVEEFCCDRLAILHMYPYLIHNNILDDKERIKAVINCFLNLRTLQMVEARCSLETCIEFEHRVDKFDVLEGFYATFYNARLHHAKDFCYDLFLESVEDITSVHQEVAAMMDYHSDEIFAPAEATVSALLYDESIRKEMASEFAYVRKNLPSDQNIKRIVSAVLHSMPDEPEGEVS